MAIGDVGIFRKNICSVILATVAMLAMLVLQGKTFDPGYWRCWYFWVYLKTKLRIYTQKPGVSWKSYVNSTILPIGDLVTGHITTFDHNSPSRGSNAFITMCVCQPDIHTLILGLTLHMFLFPQQPSRGHAAVSRPVPGQPDHDECTVLQTLRQVGA